METPATSPVNPEPVSPAEIATLLRGDVDQISRWSSAWNTRRVILQLAVIILGAGAYGAAMGWWRDPQQALYTALKFPLIILLTTLGNALLNAMLAPLLGLNLTLRQFLAAMLMSFTVASAILGGFSPLLTFVICNAPSITSAASAKGTYNFILLIQVATIALAGTIGNARLLQVLQQWAGDRGIALRVLFAWLAGNLFLGSQLSWILRPFIGSPGLPVEFVRTAAFHGNFYEAVFHSLLQIFNIK